MARVSGVLYVRVDGRQHDAIGDFTYNLGIPKKETVVGADRIHGYKEMPQVAYVEGEVRDRDDLDLEALRRITNGTVTLDLANGKTVAFQECVEVSDGTVGTENANVQIRFESGRPGEEV